jgi:hypothetical protein
VSRGHRISDDAALRTACHLRLQKLHDLAHVTRRFSASFGDGLVDQLGQFLVGQGRRQILGDDRCLRLFLIGTIGAPAGPERLGGLAATLEFPGQDGRDLVVAEFLRGRSGNLGGADRGQNHPQGALAHVVTSPHRVGQIALDSVFERSHEP